ncbi:MAG: hypothetical protein K2G45_07355 [Lachnospiraceae bacterium]|nr:hypothetical protein [Lachnospiraceae bacterium]
MRQKWRKCIIISFILITLELVGSIIFLSPYYKVRRVFDNIDAGQWPTALECYEKLSDNQKEEVMSYLDSYAASICQSYIDGHKSYEEAAAGLDAIKSIEKTGVIFDKYSRDLDHNELKKIMTEYWQAVLNYDIETAHDTNTRSMNVQKRMKTVDKEQYMIELLNEKYQDFLDEKISYDAIVSMSVLVTNSSYYDAYEYSGVILNNAMCVNIYRNHYEELVKLRDNKKYLQVMRACNLELIDPTDTNYQNKYKALYDDAYKLGIPYYEDMLSSLVSNDKKEEASELMNEIAKVYGDSFDLESVKRSMLNDWQLAYLDFTEDIEGRLKSDLANSDTGNYILENKFEQLKPDSILLHDINDDGIAEMFLFNSAFVGNDYVGCYVYTYDGSKTVYAGFVNIRSFCNDSYLLTFPISFGRSDGTEYSLTQFDGVSLYEVSSCQDMGGTYYVNGTEADELTYMSQRTSILQHESELSISNSKYDSIADAEKHIMAY